MTGLCISRAVFGSTLMSPCLCLTRTVLSTYGLHKSVITVPRQHKNSFLAGAKNANSYINRCLVTLLLDVVFLRFIC